MSSAALGKALVICPPAIAPRPLDPTALTRQAALPRAVCRKSVKLQAALALTAAGLERLRKRRLLRRRAYPSQVQGDYTSAADEWWREHPQSGDLLIGWVHHPMLADGRRCDLEVSFSSSEEGRWRSQKLGCEMPFTARMDAPLSIVLSDDKTILNGTVRVAGAVSGTITHIREGGGTFELRALPACYYEWWSQIKSKLQLEMRLKGRVVDMKTRKREEKYAQDHDDEDDNSDDEDSSEDMDGPFFRDEENDGPNALGALILQKVLGEGNGPKPKKKSKKQILHTLKHFEMKPKEVKAHLDRFVIRQDSAKELLSVAICDHYNRAKEELLGPDWICGGWEETEEEKAERIAKDKAFKEAEERRKEECKKTNKVFFKKEPYQIEFLDTDEDTILLKIEGNQINEYVNGDLAIEGVTKFEIDDEEKTYKDDTGSGSFGDDENLQLIIDELKEMWDLIDKKMKRQKRVRNYTKPNVLLLGPTGSGKTYLLKNLAELIGVPFIRADATKFTETGYVGRDAEDLMSDLLKEADGDVELAQVGIVYIDEIDKLCSDGDGRGRSFKRGTQSTFLKLMEETTITVGSGSRMAMQLPGMESMGTKLSTRHVLFVFSGAFSELDKEMREKHARDTKGFGFSSDEREQKDGEELSMLHTAGTEDLVKSGMEREFLGRIPVRVALSGLSADDLYSILVNAEQSANSQLMEDFRRYGIKLSFTEAALRAIAKKAVKEETGARALVTILENSLRRFKFNLPSLVPNCKELEVDEALIENPDQELEKFMADYQT